MSSWSARYSPLSGAFAANSTLVEQISASCNESMTAKQQAIDVIQDLPDNVDFTRIIRELAFVAGTELAREEIRRGEGMGSAEAKEKLREWISK